MQTFGPLHPEDKSSQQELLDSYEFQCVKNYDFKVSLKKITRHIGQFCYPYFSKKELKIKTL